MSNKIVNTPHELLLLFGGPGPPALVIRAARSRLAESITAIAILIGEQRPEAMRIATAYRSAVCPTLAPTLRACFVWGHLLTHAWLPPGSNSEQLAMGECFLPHIPVSTRLCQTTLRAEIRGGLCQHRM